jgi:hypothetical protein
VSVAKLPHKVYCFKQEEREPHTQESTGESHTHTSTGQLDLRAERPARSAAGQGKVNSIARWREGQNRDVGIRLVQVRLEGPSE